jgi:glycosyltransferase involved in cell wall biosynthesis
MRIVIATGIFPPEVGGPAFYSKSLAEALTTQGHDVRVVLYGSLKVLPSGVRHMLYMLKLIRHSLMADAIIAFDIYSVGLPAAAASIVTRTPVIARIGGDFIWEMYTERTHDLMPLPEIYSHRDQWNSTERFIFRVQRWVIGRVHLAFSSAWIRDLWRDVYDIHDEETSIIENPIEPKLEAKTPTRKNFLFYARPIALKNNDAFRRAFIRAKNIHPEIELEEGMVAKEELMRRMQECYAVVLPSISDVTPNYIIDAIRCGKPFILTKYSGYAKRFGELGVIVDPLSEEDMTRGVMELAEQKSYDIYKKRIEEFSKVRTFDDIAREFVAAISKTRAS